MCLVERIGERGVGFSLKHFYLINHLRMSEVCSIVIISQHKVLKITINLSIFSNPKIIYQIINTYIKLFAKQIIFN